MSIRKPTIYAHDIDNHKLEREKKTAKRILVQQEGGSCLTCCKTKRIRGQQLLCDLKNKVVKDYNYCENWKLK